MDNKIELPLGFGMALAQNEPAMKRFEMMSNEEKKSFIGKTHEVQSKSEMQSLVSSLTSGTGF